MRVSTIALLASSGVAVRLVTDVSDIYRSWGELSVYADNAEDEFGVQYVGLPDGCQVESVSTLQRHAQRFPDSVDGAVTGGFAEKVANYTRDNKGSEKDFTGPLTFLSSYRYIMNDTGLLTGVGGYTEFGRGVAFWNRYGRTLFNASTAQLQYEPTFAGNGSARPKVALRTTSQSRIQNSQINWALGFFGPSYNSTPDASLTHWESPFNVTIITEGGTENNTLASYDSCFNDNNQTNLDIAGIKQDAYKKIYLRSAVQRLSAHLPKGFNLTVQDVYAMQMTCAYEYAFVSMSDFCGLFTADEWAGFENVLDIQYYYLYSYGNPTGRAQGIGYVQELMARLTHTHIASSNSSVNATFDGSDASFPLGQAIYADFSHDDIIVSTLTALSVDFFKPPPTLEDYPPSKDTHVTLSRMTPFGANLITEVIGCADKDPKPEQDARVAYTPTQYGYDASNASSKFIRMRLNNAIIPLTSIRGGACGNSTHGRIDGLCAMDDFLKSQENSYKLSNYNYACFANYTIGNNTKDVGYDGTIVDGKTYD